MGDNEEDASALPSIRPTVTQPRATRQWHLTTGALHRSDDSHTSPVRAPSSPVRGEHIYKEKKEESKHHPQRRRKQRSPSEHKHHHHHRHHKPQHDRVPSVSKYNSDDSYSDSSHQREPQAPALVPSVESIPPPPPPPPSASTTKEKGRIRHWTAAQHASMYRWERQAKVEADMRAFTATLFMVIHYVLTIPSIGVEAILGVQYLLPNYGACEGINSTAASIVMIISAVLAAVGLTMKFNDKATKHSQASADFSTLLKKIRTEHQRDGHVQSAARFEADITQEYNDICSRTEQTPIPACIQNMDRFVKGEAKDLARDRRRMQMEEEYAQSYYRHALYLKRLPKQHAADVAVLSEQPSAAAVVSVPTDLAPTEDLSSSSPALAAAEPAATVASVTDTYVVHHHQPHQPHLSISATLPLLSVGGVHSARSSVVSKPVTHGSRRFSYQQTHSSVHTSLLPQRAASSPQGDPASPSHAV